MQIKTILIVGFLFIASLVGITGYLSVTQIAKIAEPVNQELPESVDNMIASAHLDSLAQFIRYYDEVLTQSARNYAFTGEKKWEYRYNEIVPELDDAIAEAIELGDDLDKDFFSSVNEANIALVEMEDRAFELVNEGNAAAAIQILESDEYWNQKGFYERGLRDYIARRGAHYDDAIDLSSDTVYNAADQTKDLLDSSKKIVLLFSIVALAVALGLGVFISQYIARPLHKLTQAVEDISTGKLSTIIDPSLKDAKNEIGKLAQAFDRTVVSLKVAMKHNRKHEVHEESKPEEKGVVGTEPPKNPTGQQLNPKDN